MPSDDSIMLAALAAFLLALPAGALAATKPVPVTLAGVLFNNKENPKVTLKLGGSLRFVWKDGFHNVLTSKAPAKANKVNSGDAVGGPQADRLQAHEEGQVRLLLRTAQVARHGADAHRQVGARAALTSCGRRRSRRAARRRGRSAYQMRSLRGSEATIVARGPLVCQVAP